MREKERVRSPLPQASPDGVEAALTAADIRERDGFSRTLTRLAIPIVLQGLISAAVSYADVLMLACVNQQALSAVSQASQVTFVLTLVYMGLSMGVGILSAQYWGRGDTGVMGKVLGLATRLSLLASLAFCLMAVLIPGPLMRIYTPDAALIGYGVEYLRIIGVSYLAMGLSQMMLATIKSMEQTKVCSLISASCLLGNIALNAAAIFLVFPGQPMGAVAGVAAATAISRVAEAGLCAAWMHRRSPVHLEKRHLLHTEKWLWHDFRKCTLQAQLNYLVWGGALTATSALIGHVSTDMVSAYSVASAVRNLAIVACSGLSSAGGVLLGKYLGAGRIALAREAGRRLSVWSLGMGAIAGVIVLLLRPLCLHTVSLTPEAGALLSTMLYICAYYCIGKSYNSTVICGIFCAGGDTRFGLLCDTVAMWLVILPLTSLCAFVLKLSPGMIFFVLCLDEFVKMPFVALHYRKYRWLNNLTRNKKEDGSV